ncbi:MAG: YeeE/YedE family protein [Sedimentisphaerales bacterium]|nr:YeeE/YedE family protein [Sedimentisphaerales bacterium]
MNPNATGFMTGLLFGAALYMGGLADPDKIIGTLRLKDFHAMKTITLFIIVGMLGTWILDITGNAHYSVKTAAIVSVLLGGALLGIGFGMTGYCPGTGLACAASGRIDALVSIIGMLAGAFVFILIYPSIAVPIAKIADYGKVTLPEITPVSRAVYTIVITIIGLAILFATAFKRKKNDS